MAEGTTRLILGRRMGEAVTLHTDQGEITVTIRKGEGKRVELVIDCPPSVKIRRSELATRRWEVA